MLYLFMRRVSITLKSRLTKHSTTMARTGREFAVAHGAQFAAQRLLGDDDGTCEVRPQAAR
jgi:hypothetical protein